MHYLELIKNRYSCRNYQPFSVEQEKEHLYLAATEQGLGTCRVCNFDSEFCKNLFRLSDNEEPAVLIPLSYPADLPKEKKRKPIEEILGR